MSLLSAPERDYILSLHGQKLSEREVLEIFDFIAMLDEHQSPQPTTMNGKRIAVAFFITLVHAQHHSPDGSVAAAFPQAPH